MASRSSDRPLRKDAARNRAALVATAAAAFRDDGLAVSVNEIARRADVNVATLYRHFPTKDDLVEAVLGTILEPLSIARDQALATAPDGRLLETFVREGVRAQTEHRGLVEALSRQSPADNVRDRLRAPAHDLVQPIVDRAHASGELRADFDASDLLIAMHMISVVADSAERAQKDIGRYVEFALRGLRPDPA